MAVNYNILNEISKKSSIDNLYYFILEHNNYIPAEIINKIKPILFRADSYEEACRKVFNYSKEIKENYYCYIEDEYYDDYFKDDEKFSYEELKKRAKDVDFDKIEINFVKNEESNGIYLFHIRKVEIEKI